MIWHRLKLHITFIKTFKIVSGFHALFKNRSYPFLPLLNTKEKQTLMQEEEFYAQMLYILKWEKITWIFDLILSNNLGLQRRPSIRAFLFHTFP